MITVLIADDQALVRDGFRSLLEREDDLEVVGEATDGFEAVAEAERLSPDVVLMDIRMPRMDGVQATRRILAAGSGATKVLMLTTFDGDSHVYDAMRAGAAGFLLKDVHRQDLVNAVRVVAAGDALLAPSLTRRLIEQFCQQPPPLGPGIPDGLADLTEREVTVLACIAGGRSNAEIAHELFLSESTIKSHVGHIFAKLNLRDRVQAVIVAYEVGLVRPGTS
ncbi:MAG: response regulator transcription factor [Ilumatobacteraceae bacterium]